MFETRDMDTVNSLDLRLVQMQHVCWPCSRALDYIEELLTLLTKHDEVQISENITEEAENIKVSPVQGYRERK